MRPRFPFWVEVNGIGDACMPSSFPDSGDDGRDAMEAVGIVIDIKIETKARAGLAKRTGLAKP